MNILKFKCWNCGTVVECSDNDNDIASATRMEESLGCPLCNEKTTVDRHNVEIDKGNYKGE